MDKALTNAKRILLTLALLCGSLMAEAQLNVRAAFDSAVVETGEAFTFRMTIDGADARPESVDFTPWSALLPDSNILSQSDWQFDGKQWTKQWTFIAFDSASLQLPPLEVRFSDGAHQANSDALRLEILATPAPTDLRDMADIKDIHREPVWWSDYLPWAWALGGIAIAALLLYWFINGRKKKALLGSRTVGIAPDRLALKKLDLLEQKQLWQAERYKEYYDELTLILREYVEARYNMPALASTTSEIVERWIPQTDYSEAGRQSIERLLNWADIAKFAKGVPPYNYHAEALEEARQLIKRTE